MHYKSAKHSEFHIYVFTYWTLSYKKNQDATRLLFF